MQDVPGKAMDRRRGAGTIVLTLALGALTLAAAPAPKRTPHAAPRPSVTVDPESRALYGALCAKLDGAYDSLAGGWVVRGQPLEAAVQLGLARGAEGDTLANGRALRTLRWMRGLLDSVGGGFYSNAQSADPYHTAFEKLTWPNSRRLSLLVEASRRTGDGAWQRDARFVQDYMDRVLLDGRGGFVGGQVGDRTLQPDPNGVAVCAWLTWGSVAHHPRFRDFAWKTLDRLWSENHDPQLGIVRRNEFGELAAWPQLADHVELGRALLASYAATGRAGDLERAKELGDLLLGRFEEPGRGLRDVLAMKKSGEKRRASFDAFENARAAGFLAQLGTVTGETRWADAQQRLRRVFAPDLDKGKDVRAVAEWALALRERWDSTLPEPVKWEAPPAPAPEKPKTFRVK